MYSNIHSAQIVNALSKHKQLLQQVDYQIIIDNYTKGRDALGLYTWRNSSLITNCICVNALKYVACLMNSFLLKYNIRFDI